MIKKLLFALSILICSTLYAQKKISKKDIMGLTTIEDVQAYLEKTESKRNKIVVFNEAKHRTPFVKELLELPDEGLKIVKKEHDEIYYKILEKKEILSYRCSHITLNSEGKKDMDMRFFMDKIIKDYENGFPFEVLARKHSIDRSNNNYGGDTGWFSENEDNNELEKYIINDNGTHGIGEIFVVTPPETEEYYIVLITDEPKEVAEITVFKLVDLF